MHISFFSTYDNVGGAAIAARRLFDGLRDKGIDADLYSQRIKTKVASLASPIPVFDNRWLIARMYLDRLPLYLYRNRRNEIFCPAWLPFGIRKELIEERNQIVHLHWITYGFINIKTIQRFMAPIVWTMHDMWPFTGGCHYDAGCERFNSICGNCPTLGSTVEHDLSNKVFLQKNKYWKDLNLTLVSPSRWLADCASRSTLLGRYRVEVIPNGIDVKKYHPIGKIAARRKLGLPVDKRLVLYGALMATGDIRKGFKFLDSAIKMMEGSALSEQIEMVIYGSENEPRSFSKNIKKHYMGKISDEEKLIFLYSAADVFVAPSLQDNLPNTIMEALACGTPCVAFNIGGIPDMIEHKKTGYLVQPYCPEDLMNGIKWVLSDDMRMKRLAESARKKVLKEFDIKLVAKKYVDLYREIITQ